MSQLSLNHEDRLKLTNWGFPDHILERYESRGIISMFPWQVECLTSGDVLTGGNLVYSAPTSAGKTLVAEVISLQTILERKKKVIIILPFVSVVREKMFYFQDILSNSGVRVEGFMGSYNPPGGFKNVHMAICTIEKANNLINKLMEENDLGQIGCVVVDELHLLGDPHRGYLLELLLTKIKYITKRSSGVKIQVVGMSATLPNLDLLAKWLDATLYKTDFRPIPLKEYLKIEKSIYKSEGLNLAYEIEPYFEIKNDPGDVIFLCIDTILMGYSVLVFCPSKNWCETLAQQIAAEIKRIGNEKSDVGKSIREQLNSEGIIEILERLKRCPVGLDRNLGHSVSFGVSFHHAGLTLDERDIVEGGFKENILRVIVATSTLSSGVNLPARRVIVRSPGFQGRPMDILTYKQMVGRAGRLGKDTKGESFLVCSEKERHIGLTLIQSDLPPVTSSLGVGDLSNSLKRAILEVIGSGVVGSREELETYAKCTLLSASLQDASELLPPLSSCISYLEKNEFLKALPGGVLQSSALAEAALSASLHPDQAIKLLSELYKAGKSFVLNSDLHAIYQVTPYSICEQWSVDWVKVFSIWESLTEDMHFVGQLVGVEDRFLVKAMRSNINVHSSENAHKALIHKRFFTALALQDLINEVPLNKVASKYGCNKGMLQSLQQSASTFAGMVRRFCSRLGWGSLEVILEYLSDRIHFGVQKCLLDLLRLDSLTPITARALYNSGITKLSELAAAKPRVIELALKKAIPFLSENLDLFEKRDLRCIWITGKSGFTEAEAASFFINDARAFLLKEMGLNNASWSNDGLKVVDSVYDSSTLNPFILSKGAVNNSEKNFECSSKLLKINSSQKNSPCSPKNVNNNQSQRDSPSNQEFLKINLSLKGDLVPMDKSTPKSFKDEPLADTSVASNKDPFDTLEKIEFIIDSDKEISLNRNIECDLLPCDLSISEGKENLSAVESKSLNFEKSEIFDNSFGDLTGNELKITRESSLKVNLSCQNDECINLAKSRNSLDIFFDSANFKEEMVAIEEFDSNWGGESLLEMSHILENLSQINTGTGSKRKLHNLSNTSGHEWVKKIKWSDSFSDAGIFENSPPHSSAPIKRKTEFSAFDDTFEINSYIDRLTEAKVIDEVLTPVFVADAKPCIDNSSFNSEKSIIESPNDTAKEPSVRLQFSNVISIKSSTLCGDRLNQQSSLSRIDSTKPNINVNVNNPKPNSTITHSYLEKAFSESFGENQYKTPEKITFLKSKSVSKLMNQDAVSTPPSKQTLDSQDLFSTPLPPLDGYRDNRACSRVLDRANLAPGNMIPVPPASPKSKIVTQGLKELILSPCKRKKKSADSPSKYSPLNITIHKQTPEKEILVPQQHQINAERHLEELKVNNDLLDEKHCKSLINVCRGESALEGFKSCMKDRTSIAISLEVNRENKSNCPASKIGSKIVKKLNFPALPQRYTFNGLSIDGICVYWGQKIFYISFLCPDGFCGIDIIKSFLLRQDFTICCYNVKDIVKLLFNNCRIEVKCQLKDPGVADWLLNPQEMSCSLNHLVKEYLKDPSILIPNGKSFVSDVVISWHLQLVLDRLLQQKSFFKIFTEVEMPVIKILASMEVSGMGFDQKKAKEIWESVDSILKDLEEEAFGMARRKFSLGSYNEIKKVKEALNIPNDEKNHPFMILLHNWRKLNSLKTRNMSPLMMNQGHRIHSLNETKTATGRIINHEPSLQLIPREMTVNNVTFNFRSAFVPKTGNVLVAADFCQLELRILAHFSRDETLLSLFQCTKDIFKSIAANWNRINENQVKDDMRHQVKQICYGLIYGMGDVGLSEVLGVPVTEAASLSSKFKRSYPGVQKFIDTTVESCRQNGFITTLSNRKRFLPNINSTERAVRRRGERQAVNSKIQGSACDIAKQALLNIESTLSETIPNRLFAPSDLVTCHLVHHLHDEFIYEVSQDHVEVVSKIIKSSMEDAIRISVPLPVKMRAGPSWGNLEPFS